MAKSVKSEVHRTVARSVIALRPSRHFVDDRFFRGRRTIVVGPADSALDYMDGSRIDGFDIVVRINSSQRLLPQHGSSIGFRTDVLAHSLCEDGPRGTGKIDVRLLAQQQTKLLRCPLPNADRWVPHLRLRGRLRQVNWSGLGWDPVEVRLTRPRRYGELSALLGGRAPTAGLATLDYLIGARCSELHVTGFTFFKSAYLRGYKPGVDSREDAEAWSAASKHDTEREAAVFSGLVASARTDGADIRLDDALNDMLLEHAHQGRTP